MSDVRELILSGGDLDEVATAALATSPHLGRLRVLRLISCGIVAAAENQ